MSEKTLDRLLALLIFLVPLIVYVCTMAVTVSFWDSGEFIATSYILGIPHSPGTPLYVLVGRVFTMLPLPLSIAGRVNFLSVVFSALAVMMGYLIMVSTIRFMYPGLKGGLGRFMGYAGPVVGALYLTFSDTYWRDATEAEVYALSAFVMGLCTWLALEWYRNPAGRARKAVGEVVKVVGEEERLERGHARGLVYLIIYLLALGIGFHLGTILVYGGIFILFLLVKEKAFGNVELIVFTFGFAVLMADVTLYRSSAATVVGLVALAVLVGWSAMRGGRFALAATGLLILGISVHLYMYIRSHLDPAIDMVDPQTWKAMLYHLRREQYPPSSMLVRKAPFLWQLKHFGLYFSDQFRMLGDVRVGLFNVGQALTAIPVALGLFGVAANYLRERKVWVLNFSNLLINSLGLIVFLNFSANEVRDRDYFYGPAFYFFAIFIGIGVTSLLVTTAEWAKGKGKEAARYAVPVGSLCVFLSILPAHHNWVTHDRSNDQVPRDYARNMLASVEPDAILFTGGDNDTYPLWYIQNVEHYRTDVRVIVCTLLQTSWDIKQLRDREPKVPITLTDEEIENLRPIALKDGGVAWNDDLVIQHIIQTADWKRPIYFATSVAPTKWKPYEQYLETQGFVMRLVPYQGRHMLDAFLMKRNLEEIYRFTGILTEGFQLDNSLYRDKDVSITLNNYGVAAAELANALEMQKDYAGAVRWAERAVRFAPRLKPANLMLGVYYFNNNQRGRAIEHYRNLIASDPGYPDYWLNLAWIYSNDEPSLALRKVDEALARFPDDRRFYIDGFRYAARLGKADVAKGYVQRWLVKHPDDEEVRRAFEHIDSLIQADFGAGPGGAGKDRTGS
jgi:tetratricopeptide (TPR) repeat protein